MSQADVAFSTAALTIADLNTEVNHEPRIEDFRLAEALGFSDPHKIRPLIERHRAALEKLGSFSATVAENTRKRGRPGKTYWLTKRQALGDLGARLGGQRAGAR